MGAGTALGRYVIDGKVAHGGMGIVWRARQRGAHGFERRVALKTIHPVNANDSRYRQMMIDEARVASAIIHPNVVQTLDVGDEEGVLFLVLEWVDGCSVANLHAEARREKRLLPVDRAVELLTQALAGLHAAHEVRGANGEPLEVVHRDVSPDNILVNEAGVAKLTDFGVAKAKHRLAQHTGTGEVRGKLRYMAPEQALGGEVDRRADIYAAGAVLRELISGTLPYDAESDVQQLYMLRNGLTPLPVPEEVAAPLRAIIERATSFEVGDRYQTAAALRIDLLAWASSDRTASSTATSLPAVTSPAPVPSILPPPSLMPTTTAPLPAASGMRAGPVRNRRRTVGVIAMLISAVLTASIVMELQKHTLLRASPSSAEPKPTGGNANNAAGDVSASSAAAAPSHSTALAPVGRASSFVDESASPLTGTATRPSSAGRGPASHAPTASSSARFNDYGF